MKAGADYGSRLTGIVIIDSPINPPVRGGSGRFENARPSVGIGIVVVQPRKIPGELLGGADGVIELERVIGGVLPVGVGGDDVVILQARRVRHREQVFDSQGEGAQPFTTRVVLGSKISPYESVCPAGSIAAPFVATFTMGGLKAQVPEVALYEKQPAVAKSPFRYA